MNNDQRIATAFRVTLVLSAAVLALLCALLLAHDSAAPQPPQPPQAPSEEYGWPI